MNPDIHTLTGAYAVDALPDDERALFEQHLAACDACAEEVRELRATTARMGAAAREEPPAGLKAAVMAEIDTVRQEPPTTPVADLGARRDPPRHPWYQRLLAPAAAVLAIAVLGMTAVVANMNQRIAELEARTGQVADVLAASDATFMEMPSSGGATARIVYSPTRGEGVLLADGMPAAPGDQVYELWFISDDGTTPAGVFDADERGRVTHMLTGDLSDVDAIGVTIEPAGGSPQPTSDPIMLVEV